MKHLCNSVYLSEREITQLLRGPEKCWQDFCDTFEMLNRARLKESLAQALDLLKIRNDLENL